MSDVSIASIGFTADTSGLLKLDQALQQVAGRSKALSDATQAAEAMVAKLNATAAQAFKNVPTAFGGGGASNVQTSTSQQTALTAATTTATTAIASQTTAVRASAAAHGAHGAAAYGNRLQMLELAHVGRALFDEMAAGGNVFRGLAMESGRLQIALSAGDGGVGGLLGRIGTAASGLLNPVVAATAAVAALGAVLGGGALSYQVGQDKLATSLNGIGRRSGATVGQLNSLVASAPGNLSHGEVLGLVAQYTQAGLAPDVTGSLVGLTRQYGQVTGQSTEAAGGDLAKAFADPIRGLGDLDKQLGFVDDRLMQEFTQLERSGHMQEAQSLAAEALKRALEDTADTTWTFRKALDGAENWLSNGLTSIGQGIARTLRTNGPADQLQLDRQTLTKLQAVDPIGNADEIRQLRDEIASLEKQVQGQDTAAAARRKDAVDIGVSRQAGDAIRQLMPDFARAQSAASTIEVLRQALTDDGIRSHLGLGEAGMAGQAFSNAVVMQSMAQPGVQQRQDYDLRMAGIDAFSVGEKAIVEARRAELEVLRQTGDVARASVTAQMAMNEAIAKGNSDAEDRLQLSKQNLAMVGLSPYQRALQEVDNKYKGYGGIFDKDATTGTNVTKLPGISEDLADATHKVRLALEDNAPRIDTAGAKLASAIESAAGRVSAAVSGGGAPSPFGGLSSVHFSGAAGTATPSMIADASSRTGVPANIIAAIGQFENGGKLTGGTTMLGSDGRPSSAWGFGQLTNGAAADVARVVPGFDKYNPDTAVFGSAEHLSILAGRNHGNLTAALNAYGGTPTYASNIMRRAGGGIPLNIGVSGGPAPVAPLAADMLSPDRGSYANDRAAVVKQFGGADPAQFGTPLGDATRSLDAQSATFARQQQMFGQSAAAIQGANAQQQLWNRYVQEGITPTGALAGQIETYGKHVADLAQQQQDLQAKQQLMGTIGNDAADVLSAGTIGALTGKGFGKSAESALFGIGQSLIRSGFSSLFGGIFGGGKGSGGGLLGGLFNNFQGWMPKFAAGTDDAPGGLSLVGEKGPELVNLPAHAQVIPHSVLAGTHRVGRHQPGRRSLPCHGRRCVLRQPDGDPCAAARRDAAKDR